MGASSLLGGYVGGSWHTARAKAIVMSAAMTAMAAASVMVFFCCEEDLLFWWMSPLGTGCSRAWFRTRHRYRRRSRGPALSNATASRQSRSRRRNPANRTSLTKRSDLFGCRRRRVRRARRSAKRRRSRPRLRRRRARPGDSGASSVLEVLVQDGIARPKDIRRVPYDGSVDDESRRAPGADLDFDRLRESVDDDGDAVGRESDDAICEAVARSEHGKKPIGLVALRDGRPRSVVARAVRSRVGGLNDSSPPPVLPQGWLPSSRRSWTTSARQNTDRIGSDNDTLSWRAT